MSSIIPKKILDYAMRGKDLSIASENSLMCLLMEKIRRIRTSRTIRSVRKEIRLGTKLTAQMVVTARSNRSPELLQNPFR